MKELRLTFKTADFGAISQILIDRGISFQVEPVDVAAAEPASVRERTPASKPRRPAKKTKKASARKHARPEKPAAGGLPLAGAERLREALGQGRTSSSPLVPPTTRPGEGTDRSDEPPPSGGRGD